MITLSKIYYNHQVIDFDINVDNPNYFRNNKDYKEVIGNSS